MLKLEKNTEHKIKIKRLGSEGQGIGHIDGMTIFVEGAITDDEVLIKIILVKKKFAVGKLLEIIDYSENRIIPPCKYFMKCGGCSIQHVDYKEQLAYKKDKVYNNILRIGKIDTDIKDTLGMDNPFRYRNKSQFPVRANKEGNIDIGFFRKRSHDVINIDDCLIQDRSNTVINKIIKTFMENNNIAPYDEFKNQGLIRHIVTRAAFKTNELMITLVINGDELPKKELLIEELTKELSSIKSINININKEKTNVIFGDNTINIYGNGYIIDNIGDLSYKISPLSFYQVNSEMTKVMYDKVFEYANLEGHETVIDAYCGIGTISLYLANYCKKIYGIEIVEEAIVDAKENAKLNNIDNTIFIAGKSDEESLKLHKEDKVMADVFIVDPPRKGCEPELLETMINMKPSKIIYVSCDPATLARDLNMLCKDDVYEVKEVQPIDSFCQTHHVETIVLLERAD